MARSSQDTKNREYYKKKEVFNGILSAPGFERIPIERIFRRIMRTRHATTIANNTDRAPGEPSRVNPCMIFVKVEVAKWCFQLRSDLVFRHHPIEFSSADAELARR